MVDPSEIVGKIGELTDLELAILLCLVASQHCLIETEREALESTGEELQLVSNEANSQALAETWSRLPPMSLESLMRWPTAPNP